MFFVPSQLVSIASPPGMISRDSSLPHDARNLMGTSGRVFENLLARDGPSSAFFVNPKNFALSSCGLRQRNTGNIIGVRREAVDSEIPTPRFAKGLESGTFYIVLEGLIFELFDGNSEVFFLVTASRKLHRFNGRVNAGRSTSRPKCANTPLSYTHNVVYQRSRDRNFRRRSCDVCRLKENFLDSEMLDAKTASAPRKIITNANLPWRVSVEEQRAQKHDRFPRGKQTAH